MKRGKEKGISSRLVIILIIIAIVLAAVSIAVSMTAGSNISMNKSGKTTDVRGGKIGVEILPPPVEDKGVSGG